MLLCNAELHLHGFTAIMSIDSPTGNQCHVGTSRRKSGSPRNDHRGSRSIRHCIRRNATVNSRDYGDKEWLELHHRDSARSRSAQRDNQYNANGSQRRNAALFALCFQCCRFFTKTERRSSGAVQAVATSTHPRAGLRGGM